ncbi:hypothetical protein ACFMPF_24830, partial [Citrobacter sp. S5]|uniref:hypothetical protein n=1 Tax=Citrobacter sp. S5 TaxID=3351561 RepID=UPI003D2932D8
MSPGRQVTEWLSELIFPDFLRVELPQYLVHKSVISQPDDIQWIGPYISIHFLSLNPLLVRRRRYSR